MGLNYLHSNNIIHRDLKVFSIFYEFIIFYNKPENILLTSEDVIKLCDFGWSAEIDEVLEKRDTICGTCDYMAPEMV